MIAKTTEFPKSLLCGTFIGQSTTVSRESGCPREDSRSQLVESPDSLVNGIFEPCEHYRDQSASGRASDEVKEIARLGPNPDLVHDLFQHEEAGLGSHPTSIKAQDLETVLTFV
jgi:hypothetical protein